MRAISEDVVIEVLNNAWIDTVINKSQRDHIAKKLGLNGCI